MISNILSVILFFVIMTGLGHGLLLLFKIKIENTLERFVMKCGTGLSIFLVLGVIFNLIRIPLYWWIFFILSLIGPIYSLYKKQVKFCFPKTIKQIHIFGLILLLLFGFNLFQYASGAFSYPWLENGDPQTHMMGSKYISIEKTLYEPDDKFDYFWYVDAYPPGYDFTLGMMEQFNQDIYFSVKFFNALILALAIPFSYFFFRKLTNDSRKALFGAFILCAIPSFMSHFIWAHSLAITMVPIIFYCALHIGENKNWAWVTGLVLGASILTSPTQPIKFIALFFIFMFVKLIYNKQLWKQYSKVLLITILIGLIWWTPYAVKIGGNPVSSFLGPGRDLFQENDIRVSKPFIGFLGSATRLYTLKDFMFATSNNHINNPIGLGLVVFLLLLVGLLTLGLDKKILNKQNDIFIILFFIFTLCGLYGGTVFPVALFSFRFWALFCFPVAIIAASGFIYLYDKLKGNLKMLFVVVSIVGIIVTSGVATYTINTSSWYPDSSLMKYGQFAEGEGKGYLYLKTMEPSNIYYACNHEFFFPDAMIILYGHNSRYWNQNVLDFKQNFFNLSTTNIKSFMSVRDYNYLMFDGNCQDQNVDVNAKINELINGGFTLEHQSAGVLILKK